MLWRGKQEWCNHNFLQGQKKYQYIAPADINVSAMFVLNLREQIMSQSSSFELLETKCGSTSEEGEFCLISRGFGRDGIFCTTWKPCERELQSGIWDKVAKSVDIPDKVEENATEQEFNCSALCRPTKVLLHPSHHWTLSKSGKGAILLFMVAV